MKRLALLLCLLPACADKNQPTADSNSPTQPADRWAAPPSQTQGDVRVTVTGAAVEPIPAGDLSEVFVVHLTLENVHASRRGQYRTWATSATLTDNFGNQYKRIVRPLGTGVTAVPLNPAVSVADVLMFEAPILTAGRVELALPAGNAGVSGDFRLRIELQTSGARLETVRQAAAAQEAEAAARLAAIKASQDAAQRKAEADRQERLRADEQARREAAEKQAKRLEAEATAQREAEARKAEADKLKAEAALKAEQARLEAEKRRREDEIAAMPAKLATAKKSLEETQSKLNKIKLAKSRYVFSGPVPPADYFDNATGKYIYFTVEQKAARSSELQKDADRLTAEIAGLEANLKTPKP